MKILLEMTAEAETGAYTVVEVPDDLTPIEIRAAAEQFRDEYEDFPMPEIIGAGTVDAEVLADDDLQEADEDHSQRMLEIIEAQRKSQAQKLLEFGA